MIDEIDKMGADWRGDPSSAMLEVLDPAQNSSFRDHYLDLPFDLSQVLFICTANQLETIPPPLLDRMEIIRLSGYTEEEKLGIAKRYLVPKQLEAHGLDPRADQVLGQGPAPPHRASTRARPASATSTARSQRSAARQPPRSRRESGSASASTSAASAPGSVALASAGEVRKRTSDPGVATGLAVTPVGGDVLFIEATAMPGEGRLIVTGPARRRHARVRAGRALLGARPRDATSGCEADWFEGKDVHIHVPAGAVPKDGPSAGIAMATALSSLAWAGRSPRRSP